MVKMLTLSDFSKRALVGGRKPPLRAGKRAELMNVAEVAERLGMSKQAVHKAIGAGKLQGYRIVQDHDRDRLVAIVIDSGSVDQYELARSLQRRAAVGGR